MAKKRIIKSNDDELYTPEAIDYSLGNPDSVPEHARLPLAKALSLLPHDVIDYITENYIFITEDEKGGGSHWLLDDIPFRIKIKGDPKRGFTDYDKSRVGFILLNTDFWNKKPMEINFTIAHEVAHAFKKHINPLNFDNFARAIEQELEADKQAVEWLSKHYKKETLKKLCSYWGDKELLKKYKKLKMAVSE